MPHMKDVFLICLVMTVIFVGLVKWAFRTKIQTGIFLKVNWETKKGGKPDISCGSCEVGEV